jgi:hypothetical protein
VVGGPHRDDRIEPDALVRAVRALVCDPETRGRGEAQAGKEIADIRRAGDRRPRGQALPRGRGQQGSNTGSYASIPARLGRRTSSPVSAVTDAASAAAAAAGSSVTIRPTLDQAGRGHGTGNAATAASVSTFRYIQGDSVWPGEIQGRGLSDRAFPISDTRTRRSLA